MPIPVKDVLKTAAELIGEEELLAEIGREGPSSEGLSLLLKCFNLIENEVAIDYLPLKNSEKLPFEQGELPYTKLSRPPVHLYRVIDAGGYDLRFKSYPDRIVLEEPVPAATVVYAYAPHEKTAEDDSDFPSGVSARLFAYGTAAEYLLARGKYREAALFDRKYREALTAAAGVRKKLSMRTRRWV